MRGHTAFSHVNPGRFVGRQVFVAMKTLALGRGSGDVQIIVNNVLPRFFGGFDIFRVSRQLIHSQNADNAGEHFVAFARADLADLPRKFGEFRNDFGPVLLLKRVEDAIAEIKIF